jgi:hypothetical protein
MPTLKTITTIELSSVCNLQCDYCINRLIKHEPVRSPGIMDNKVFDASLELLQELVNLGTQKEVNLNGNGESFLDAQLITRIQRTKRVMDGKGTVMLCTNAIMMTDHMAQELKDAGLDRIDLSIHSPYHARRAVDILSNAGLYGVVNTGVILTSHNWAGQLEQQHRIRNDRLPKIDCAPLIEGRGYIQSEGNISPCCYDFRNLGVFGGVFDSDILDRIYGPYSLCDGCHQKIPAWITRDWEKRNGTNG